MTHTHHRPLPYSEYPTVPASPFVLSGIAPEAITQFLRGVANLYAHPHALAARIIQVALEMSVALPIAPQ